MTAPVATPVDELEESFEDEHACEILFARYDKVTFEPSVVVPCGKPAAWMATCPGCGHACLICQHHKDTMRTVACTVCRKNRPVSEYIWRTV